MARALASPARRLRGACVVLVAGAAAGAPPAAPAPPNFLLLFPDQWRWDWAGSAYGLPLRMPRTDALVAGGTRFGTAFVPSPLCAPSRSCLASGREYDLAGVPDNFSNDYPLNETTFYSLLQAAGYHTMTVGKDDLTKATGPGEDGSFHAAALGWSSFARVDGKDDVLAGGVPHEPYGNFLKNHTTRVGGKEVTLWHILDVLDDDCCKGINATFAEAAVAGAAGYDCDTPTLMPQAAYEDDYVGAAALAILAAKPANTPWFLQVSFPGPHPPFIVTAAMRNATHGRPGFPDAVDNPHVPHAEQQVVRQLYAAELENLDAWFGRIIDALNATGDLDNTVVIVASDHGEMLGDHDDWGKTMPWQGSASVPLVVYAPRLGVPAGATVAAPVATLDIAGTVLDYAGVARAENMTTQSLRPFFGAPAAGAYRSFVSSGLGAWRMAVQAQGAHVWKLVCCGGTGVCPGQPGNASWADEDWAASGAAAAMERRAGAPPLASPPAAARARAAAAAAAAAAPAPPLAAAASAFNVLLFDVAADRFDLDNVAASRPDVVAAMTPLLPPGWCGA